MAEKGKELASPADIRALISSDVYKRQFAMALPKHLKPERFIRIALTALTRVPKLAQCTQASLVKCLLDLSALGLEPDGRKAHLIPYGDVCTLIIDYKGLVDLARRTGEVADIHADVVCEGDSFEYSFGSDGKLVHKPALKNRGKITAAYSFVRLKDGSTSYEVMSLDEIDAIRKRSKAGQAGPWVSDYNEMAKKTVFRRHSKWLPVSSELLQTAIEKDADIPIDITPIEPAGKPEVDMPQAASSKPAQEDQKPSESKYAAMLDAFAEMKKSIGEDKYYKILGSFGYEKSNQITKVEEGTKILMEMGKAAKK